MQIEVVIVDRVMTIDEMVCRSYPATSDEWSRIYLTGGVLHNVLKMIYYCPSQGSIPVQSIHYTLKATTIRLSSSVVNRIARR